MLLKSFDKMTKAKQNEHLHVAENFLRSLDSMDFSKLTLD